MSTNFYMFTNRKDLKPFFGSRLEIVDEPDFGYMIPIAKTSAGWKPLFYAHDHIRSIMDLKILYDKGGVRIFDGYDKEYDWAAFVKRVVEYGNEKNWRTWRDNDCPTKVFTTGEFTSVDGYRFLEV